MALVSLLAAARAAPVIRDGLTARGRGRCRSIVTGAAQVGAIAALAARRYPIRARRGGQVGLIVCGWGLAQYPWLVRPICRFDAAAATPSERCG